MDYSHIAHCQDIAQILLEKSNRGRERSSIKDSCAIFSLDEKGRVKLQVTAMSKTAGENGKKRLRFVWILTNLNLPLKVESDVEKEFLKKLRIV